MSPSQRLVNLFTVACEKSPGSISEKVCIWDKKSYNLWSVTPSSGRLSLDKLELLVLDFLKQLYLKKFSWSILFMKEWPKKEEWNGFPDNQSMDR